MIGFLTYFWIVDFPENSHRSFHFLPAEEQALAETRIREDRGDVQADPFAGRKCIVRVVGLKIYGFCALFFCLNLVSTSLSYFLPVILQSGMGSLKIKPSFSRPSLLLRHHPIVGFSILGFSSQVTVRYVGTYPATGAYVSNWAAMNAYQASNIVGQ